MDSEKEMVIDNVVSDEIKKRKKVFECSGSETLVYDEKTALTGPQYALTNDEKIKQKRNKDLQDILTTLEAEIEKVKADLICSSKVFLPEEIDAYPERSCPIAACIFIGPENYPIYNPTVAFCPLGYFRTISAFENWKAKMKDAGKDYGIIGLRQDVLVAISNDAKDLFSVEYQKHWIREMKIARIQLVAADLDRFSFATKVPLSSQVEPLSETKNHREVIPLEAKQSEKIHKPEEGSPIYLEDTKPPKSLSMREQFNVGLYQFISIVPNVPILNYVGAGWIDPRRSEVSKDAPSRFHSFVKSLQDSQHPTTKLGPLVQLWTEEWKPVVCNISEARQYHLADDSLENVLGVDSSK